MAASNYSNTFESTGIASNGHYMKWEIPKLKLRHTPNWELKKIFRTNCETSNSVWEILICFNRMEEKTTLKVVVKRVDGDFKVPLKAHVDVEVKDSRERLVFPKQDFEKDGTFLGNHMQATVDLVPYSSMEPAVDKSLSVMIHLTISNCHGIRLRIFGGTNC